MRIVYTCLLLAQIGLISGCAGDGHPLVLDPVGPRPLQPVVVNSNGSLVVYSAFDVLADFNSVDPERRRHTDYRILSEDGRLLQKVNNDTRTILEGPVAVALPAGNYRVVARAQGYKLVTVPVVIAANRVTTVHLEGGDSWPNKAAFNGTNAVRLPDGRIVGWRAVAESPKNFVGGEGR